MPQEHLQPTTRREEASPLSPSAPPVFEHHEILTQELRRRVSMRPSSSVEVLFSGSLTLRVAIEPPAEAHNYVVLHTVLPGGTRVLDVVSRADRIGHVELRDWYATRISMPAQAFFVSGGTIQRIDDDEVLLMNESSRCGNCVAGFDGNLLAAAVCRNASNPVMRCVRGRPLRNPGDQPLRHDVESFFTDLLPHPAAQVGTLDAFFAAHARGPAIGEQYRQDAEAAIRALHRPELALHDPWALLSEGLPPVKQQLFGRLFLEARSAR